MRREEKDGWCFIAFIIVLWGLGWLMAIGFFAAIFWIAKQILIS